MALLRTTPNYEAAFRLFEGDTGNNIRDYVFRREWASLSYGPDSRSVLAALSILNRPVSAADLLVILQFGEGRLRDAVSATRAMFLQVNDAGKEAMYSLDVMTREFVLREAESIDHIGTLRARIKNFDKTYFPEVPQISRVAIRAGDLIRKAARTQDQGYLMDAWALVTDLKLAPSVVEHPQFKSIYGYVASKVQPARLDDARAAFKFVMGTKYEPPVEHLRAWFDAERDSGIGFTNCLAICDFVSNGRAYDRQDKVDFLSLRATSMFHRGREKAIDDPVESAQLYTSALKAHCSVYKHNLEFNSVKAASSEKYIRNTTFSLLDLCVRNFSLDQTLVHLFDVLNAESGYLDPIEEPIRLTLSRLHLRGYEGSTLHKAKKVIAKVLGTELRPDLWMDKTSFTRIKAVLAGVDASISGLLKQRA